MTLGLRNRAQPLALAAVSSLLAALISAAPVHADSTIYPPSYGSNGVFGVGVQPREGLTAYIPPGRYRVDQSPSMPPYQSAPGYWLRCHAIPCSGTHPQHIIATGHAVREHSTFMDVLPTDTAVFLANVTLTFVG